jgi:hypothetical protein
MVMTTILKSKHGSMQDGCHYHGNATCRGIAVVMAAQRRYERVDLCDLLPLFTIWVAGSTNLFGDSLHDFWIQHPENP